MSDSWVASQIWSLSWQEAFLQSSDGEYWLCPWVYMQVPMKVWISSSFQIWFTVPFFSVFLFWLYHMHSVGEVSVYTSRTDRVPLILCFLKNYCSNLNHFEMASCSSASCQFWTSSTYRDRVLPGFSCFCYCFCECGLPARPPSCAQCLFFHFPRLFPGDSGGSRLSIICHLGFFCFLT